MYFWEIRRGRGTWPFCPQLATALWKWLGFGMDLFMEWVMPIFMTFEPFSIETGLKRIWIPRYFLFIWLKKLSKIPFLSTILPHSYLLFKKWVTNLGFMAFTWIIVKKNSILFSWFRISELCLSNVLQSENFILFF